MIVYYSKTNKTKMFIDRLQGTDIMRITNTETPILIHSPFIMITPTYGNGNPPKEVLSFIEKNKEYIRGVVGVGNKNFGLNYARSANVIASKYRVPIITKVEFKGLQEDVLKVERAVEELCQMNIPVPKLNHITS